jgi:hypothetical protein
MHQLKGVAAQGFASTKCPLAPTVGERNVSNIDALPLWNGFQTRPFTEVVMFKKFVIVGATALLALTASPQTFAQTLEIGPNGVRMHQPDTMNEPDRMRRDEGIDEREAVRIARHEGLRQVDGVRRTRSAYVVQGTDRRGNDIRVDVDRRTGEVVSVE